MYLLHFSISAAKSAGHSESKSICLPVRVHEAECLGMERLTGTDCETVVDESLVGRAALAP